MEGQNKIRVLVVDDIAETRDNVSKYFMFERDIEVVGTATNGREGVEMCRTLHPDVVLMDINMPDMDGIQATELITSELPGIAVIMMSVQGEQDYLRRSMLAGARGFLTKPMSTDELIKSVRDVYRLETSRKKLVSYAPQNTQNSAEDAAAMGRVFTIFSPKGGVGRTTVACNLAVALKQATNKRVALIDGSFTFGDVGVALNLLSNKTVYDLVTRIDHMEDELLSDVLVTHSSGVKVLLAPTQPELSESITEDALRIILAQMRKSFDYIIIDTAPNFSPATLALTDMADRILLVMTLEMPSIKNIKIYLELTSKLGYPPEKIMLVLNRADAKMGIPVENVEDSLRHKVDFSLASDPRAVTLSVNQGVPLVISARENVFSTNVIAMAQRIGEIKFVDPNAEKDKPAPPKKQQEQQPPQQQSGGFLSRFKLPMTNKG